jgi:hydroxycarboxylate dehydrogenase B
MADSSRRVPVAALTALVDATFQAAGSQPQEAAVMAEHLVEANLQGHDSHGVIRVAKYLGWLRDGLVQANRHARIAIDAGALLAVDGLGGYGQVIAREAVAIACERALAHGMCLLALRDCGHVGRVGAWAEQAAEAGFVSVHFVNTSGFGMLVAPFGGSDRRLSANPIAAGCPVEGGPPLVLDIATSTIAEGKIQVARNKGEMLPEGAVLDGHGRPTRDPEAFYAQPPGAIHPFGGHKGSGLSFFCEVLAGSLTGGASSHPDNPSASRLVNNMLSLLVDPARLAGSEPFAADLARLMAWTRGSPPLEPGGEVLLPGEIERRTRAERLEVGVPLDAGTLRQLRDAATGAGVPAGQVAAVLGA